MIELTEVKPYKDKLNNRITTQSPAQRVAKIRFHGKNNTIIVDEGVYFYPKTQLIFFMDDATVHIKKDSRIYTILKIGNGCYVEIGERCRYGGCFGIMATRSRKVIIGDDCLFAPQTELKGCDLHVIYDVATETEINHSKDIILENHVWLGVGATVLKGVTVGQGSIIGLGGIVTHNVPNNCIVAGIPAKVVKRHIAWEISNPMKISNYTDLKTYDYWGLTREPFSPLQKQVLKAYSLIVSLFSTPHNRKVYKDDPQLFFITTKHPLKLFVKRILNKLGSPLF